MNAVLAVADEGDIRRVGLVAEGRLAAPAWLIPAGSNDAPAGALADLLAEMESLGHRVVGVAAASSPGRAGPESEFRRLGLPVLRVRRAEAVREAEWHGALHGARHLLVIDCDGPDAAMVLDGRVRAGAAGSAGAIAHLGLDRPGSVRCACGRRGCFGALLAAGARAPAPPRPPGRGPARMRSLDWLALAAIALVNVVNPEFLVVAGALVTDEDDLAQLAATVMAGCLSATAEGLSAVVLAEPDAALVGAASLFLASDGRGAASIPEET